MMDLDVHLGEGALARPGEKCSIQAVMKSVIRLICWFPHKVNSTLHQLTLINLSQPIQAYNL